MSDLPIDLCGKSLLIFDDGLRSIEGHWYEYDRAVADIHLSRGARVTLICNEQFTKSEAFRASGVEVLPVVNRSVWSGDVPPSHGIREIGRWFRHAAYFARLLNRHLATREYDLVFVPNAMIYDALAWTMLRFMIRFRKKGRLVLLFRFSIHHHPTYTGRDPDVSGELPKRFAVWRLIFQSLERLFAPGKVAFVTDSLRLAKDYARAAGISPKVVPSPRTITVLEGRRNASMSRPMTFALIGFARWARGVDLFDQAITQLIESGRASNLRFILQWHHDVLDSDGVLCKPSSVLAESDQVTIIDRSLPSDEYEAIFAEIDCMVLPYRREFYLSQISGVAIEAACSDIPMIVTEDTWLADFLADQGAGITVPNNDAAALADAIAEMAASRSHYANKAQISGARARACNTPEQFLHLLWGEAPESQSAASAG